MLNFRNFFLGVGQGGGLPPSQMIVIKLHIKEMHFKNVDHWAHALYMKILNTFKLLKDCTSSSSSVIARNYFCSPMTTTQPRLCRH